MPADACAGIIAGEEDVHELVRLKARESGRPLAKDVEPIGDRIGRREARVVEVVAPAEALRPAVAEPAVESERRHLELAELAAQRRLLRFIDETFLVAKPG